MIIKLFKLKHDTINFLIKLWVVVILLFCISSLAHAQHSIKQEKKRYATIDIFTLKGKGKGKKVTISYKKDSLQIIKHKNGFIDYMVTHINNGLLLTRNYFLDSKASLVIDSSYHNDSILVRLNKQYIIRNGIKLFNRGKILIFSKINDRDVRLLFCTIDIKLKKEPMLIDFIKNDQVNLFCSEDAVYCDKVFGGILKDEYEFKVNIKLNKVLLEELFFNNLLFNVLECKDF